MNRERPKCVLFLRVAVRRSLCSVTAVALKSGLTFDSAQSVEQSLPTPGSSTGGASPVSAWTFPAQVHATPGRWLAEGWALVSEDIGSYILIALLFFLLSAVPFIQGALVAGFHIYTMKKIMGRSAEIGDFFKGFQFLRSHPGGLDSDRRFHIPRNDSP